MILRYAEILCTPKRKAAYVIGIAINGDNCNDNNKDTMTVPRETMERRAPFRMPLRISMNRIVANTINIDTDNQLKDISYPLFEVITKNGEAATRKT